ncbi:MAG: VCBS repeat-containing protein, partial [Planctomycetota bacterium]
MHPSKPLSIALAVALTGTAAAQIDTGGFFITGNPADRVYTHQLDKDKSTTHVVTGEVTNDLITDVVAIMDGVVQLIVGPLYFNVQLDLPLPVGHIVATACTTQAIESAKHEDVVASTALGLVRWIRNDATGDYAPVSVNGSTVWAGAQQLFVANVYPGAADELVGLFQDVNGDTLVRVGSLDAAGITNLASGLLPSTALSLHAINRDTTSPRDEIAVLFPTATFYLRSQGSTLNAFAVDFYIDPAVCAAAIDDSRGEALAVVHETDASGEPSYELGVYRVSGASESRIPLGAQPILEIAASQAAGDDGLDVATLTAGGVTVWRNKSAQTGGSFELYPAYPTDALNNPPDGTIITGDLTGLAFTDFDGDGDADIYVESEQPGWHKAIAHVNPSVSQYVQAPLVQLPETGDELDESNSIILQRGPTQGS